MSSVCFCKTTGSSSVVFVLQLGLNFLFLSCHSSAVFPLRFRWGTITDWLGWEKHHGLPYKSQFWLPWSQMESFDATKTAGNVRRSLQKHPLAWLRSCRQRRSYSHWFFKTKIFTVAAKLKALVQIPSEVGVWVNGMSSCVALSLSTLFSFLFLLLFLLLSFHSGSLLMDALGPSPSPAASHIDGYGSSYWIIGSPLFHYLLISVFL